MLNIIIVEDHRPLRETLVDVMAAEGHQVAAFDSAEAFCVRSDLGSVDILVLDLNLPGEDGISLARRVRAEHPGIGIVMLSARAEPEQREIGYETGADIYLTKPSSAPELTSSIRALARRISRNPVPNGLVLDPKAMTLTGAAETVKLTAAEAEIMQEFIRSPDNRVTTDRIIAITGSEGEMSKAAIEVRIVRLRKKIRAAGAIERPINAIRNYGYQLSVRVDIA